MKFAIITAIAVTAVASAALLRSTQESETAAAAPRPDYSSLPSRAAFADLDLELARDRARGVVDRVLAHKEPLRKQALGIIDDPTLTPEEKEASLRDIMKHLSYSTDQ